MSSSAAPRLRAVDRALTALPTGIPPAIVDRKISKNAVRQYKVTVTDNQHIYPYFDSKGNHVSNKIRTVETKDFFCEGDVKASTLFGQQAFPPNSAKAITITEGELDAMSAYDMFGNRYPCVSVRSASEAKRNCADQLEYLSSFPKVYICFDADEPGQKAARQVAELFEPGKAHIVKLGKYKDASDYLKNNAHHEFTKEWYSAQAFTPDDLQLGNDPDLLTAIVDYKEPESIPFPWEGLNKATYGLRLSEVSLFLADTGIGKTTFMKEIEYKLLTDEELIKRGYGVGFLHLEETKRDTALGLMSIHKNKPYHLPDTVKTREELVDAYNEVVNTERVVIWDSFGSNDVGTVLARIRQMAALGCKYIVIDHLSIICSDQSGDERKQLDEISTKLKTLTMNLNICCVCVMHLNRAGLARGSAGPEQIANNVIRLERDKKEADEWRRNITRMSVEKCRLSGRTGPASWVRYDSFTGRLQELDDNDVNKFESGGKAGEEF